MESGISESPTVTVDEEAAEVAKPTRPARRGLRRLGTVLAVLGVVALAYGATIYFWRDPVTDLWARWKQSQLSAELDETIAAFEPAGAAAAAESGGAASGSEPTIVESGPQVAVTPAADPASAEAPPPITPTTEAPTAATAAEAVGGAAKKFEALIEPGDAIGRIVIPRLGIDPIVVNGTVWGRDLSRGPGLYPESSLPGLGPVAAIAGHRTTFGAWFRHIDDLKSGDPIDLVLPYGTFHYEVAETEIVDNDDWSILDPRPYDALVLSACHPLYGASERYIVYAKLTSVERADGTTVAISS